MDSSEVDYSKKFMLEWKEGENMKWGQGKE